MKKTGITKGGERYNMVTPFCSGFGQLHLPPLSWFRCPAKGCEDTHERSVHTSPICAEQKQPEQEEVIEHRRHEHLGVLTD